jgi:ribonuclease BN (tRNA processing enzyme)
MEFGATALLTWKQAGFSTEEIDAVVVSHLHGDHFGGLPFLLLDCQYATARTRPLRIFGPRGLRARLEMAMEVLFPGSSAIRWNFAWDITELTPMKPVKVAGFDLSCAEVIHPSGAQALGLRLRRGDKVLGFSGDTSWTPNLVTISQDATLFLCECFSGADLIVNHLNWDVIRENLPRLRARKIVLTHMNDSAFALGEDMAALGIERAKDGAVYEL